MILFLIFQEANIAAPKKPSIVLVRIQCMILEGTVLNWNTTRLAIMLGVLYKTQVIEYEKFVFDFRRYYQLLRASKIKNSRFGNQVIRANTDST